jgi:IclR family transcriptional regulator, pca regulon regulatory protein
MTDKAIPTQRGDLVQSFERGLAVVRAFAGSDGELTLTEVADRAGVTRAAARRFLLTLVELGYMRTDGKLFALRPTILELGNAYLSGLGLGDVALPHMRNLVKEVNDASALCVLSDDDIVYVALARVPGHHVMVINVTIGAQLPAYPTSMGRVLLAGQSAEWRERYLSRTELRAVTPYTIEDPGRLRAILDQVGADGYSIVDQELDLGLRSIAVPIRRAGGQVYAALNVSMHPSRRSGDAIRDELLDPLRRTADMIEADMASIARRRAAMHE